MRVDGRELMNVCRGEVVFVSACVVGWQFWLERSLQMWLKRCVAGGMTLEHR